MPFLIFVVPRVYTSLHPNLVQVSGANVKVAMASSMRVVLYSSMIAFAGLFFWLHSLEVRLARLRMAADGEEG